jgi:outer membrane protein TolC
VELNTAERDRAADESFRSLFANQEAISKPLSLYEATARAVKYQTDYRVRIMEEAATLAQIEVSRFDMLPKLTGNAGYSTRNNDSFGFGFSPNGTPATNPSASSERSHSTASIGFMWNIMDFGVSYFRAKQLADQKLIAAERRRKAVQNLIQDVRLAWWRAEAAQRLLPMIDAYFEDVDQAIERTRIIENRKLLPPMQTASLRRALLDLQQQISLRREELAQAKLELAALVNAPPGTEVIVSPPTEYPAATLDLKESIPALEALALRNRPEIAEEIYKARISESEAKKAIVGLLPGLNLDLTRNFDSNKYLVNNYWTSAGIGIAFNLVKAFSLPAVNRSAEAQARVDETRRLAMAMAVLTQTRIAAVRFGLMEHEYGVWDEATQDDRKIVQFLESSAEVGIDTELELIRAKGRYTVSKINRDIMYANLEAALGRIYNSTGLDPGTVQADKLGTEELADQMSKSIAEWHLANFSTKAPSQAVAVSLGKVTGVPDDVLAGFRTALEGVFGQSKLTIVAEAESVLQILVDVSVAPPKGGGRPAAMKVRLIDSKTGAVKLSTEFKTTLSDPVDDEQWRTLGEGAAYRVLGPILRMQSGKSMATNAKSGEAVVKDFKLASSLTRPVVSEAEESRNSQTPDDALFLRMDRKIAPNPLQSISSANIDGVKNVP